MVCSVWLACGGLWFVVLFVVLVKIVTCVWVLCLFGFVLLMIGVGGNTWFFVVL